MCCQKTKTQMEMEMELTDMEVKVFRKERESETKLRKSNLQLVNCDWWIDFCQLIDFVIQVAITTVVVPCSSLYVVVHVQNPCYIRSSIHTASSERRNDLKHSNGFLIEFKKISLAAHVLDVILCKCIQITRTVNFQF